MSRSVLCLAKTVIEKNQRNLSPSNSWLYGWIFPRTRRVTIDRNHIFIFRLLSIWPLKVWYWVIHTTADHNSLIPCSFISGRFILAWSLEILVLPTFILASSDRPTVEMNNLEFPNEHVLPTGYNITVVCTSNHPAKSDHKVYLPYWMQYFFNDVYKRELSCGGGNSDSDYERSKVCKYFIQNATEDNSGNYTCISTNSYGCTMKTMALMFKGNISHYLFPVIQYNKWSSSHLVWYLHDISCRVKLTLYNFSLKKPRRCINLNWRVNWKPLITISYHIGLEGKFVIRLVFFNFKFLNFFFFVFVSS